MDTLPWSSLIELPAGVQVVEVQDRVEHHEVPTDGLASIDGVIGEQYDMSFPNRDVDDYGTLCNIVSTLQQPRDEQRVLSIESHRNPRPELRRYERRRFWIEFILG